VTLAAYANSFAAGFALDNRFILLEDPRLRAATRANVDLIFGEDYWWPKAVGGVYRPLATLSFLFNYAVLGNGPNPVGWHVVNFLLHWLNVVLAWRLGLRVGAGPWAAAAMAVLFGVHPLGAESVTNIIGRADLMATASVLGGTLLYAWAVERGGAAKWLGLAGVSGVLGAGLLCKESAATLGGVVVAYDLLFRLRPAPAGMGTVGNLLAHLRGWLPGWLMLVPPVLVVAMVRAGLYERSSLPEISFVDNPMRGADWLTARLTAVETLGRYLWLLVWPARLSCDYSYNVIPMFPWRADDPATWRMLGSALALGLIGLALWRGRNSGPGGRAALFLGAFAAVTMLPTANLVILIGAPMAERFAYLPMVGAVGVLAVLLDRLAGPAAEKLTTLKDWTTRRQAVTVLLAAAAVALAARTLARNADWTSDLTLWTSTVETVPDSFRAHRSLGYALHERWQADRTANAADLDRAIAEAEAARDVCAGLPVEDRDAMTLMHLGMYLGLKGEALCDRGPDGRPRLTAAAEPWFVRAVDALRGASDINRRYNDDYRRRDLARGRRPEEIPDVGLPKIYEFLGVSLRRLGRPQDAMDAFRQMRRVEPTAAGAYLQMADLLLEGDRLPEAAVRLIQALLLDSSNAEAWGVLERLYIRLDPRCPAVQRSSAGAPGLNLDCPAVRRDLDAAFADFVRELRAGGRPALAEATRLNAITQYRCRAELFAAPRE
jgi:tetratricopeptide (TPR) repeat protein